MATAKPLTFRIEGMDCAACATKIENALRRLPGVSDIAVSYGQGSLSLLVDEDRTSRVTIEGRVRALGFMPVGGDAGEKTRIGRRVSPGFIDSVSRCSPGASP
jgi:Cd2+/Zn2+-exporting ATPase